MQFKMCDFHSFVHLTDLSTYDVSGPKWGAGNTAVNETGAQWGKETTNKQNSQINKLLRSNSAAPRIKIGYGENWGTVERWRASTSQSPWPVQRAQRLGEFRGEPKGKGREGWVRSALERWQATAGGLESEAGVPDHSPGVECCRRFRHGS